LVLVVVAVAVVVVVMVVVVVRDTVATISQAWFTSASDQSADACATTPRSRVKGPFHMENAYLFVTCEVRSAYTCISTISISAHTQCL
jgi:hypothetical protein